MDTLQQIQAKLKNIMLTSNIESPELDALNLLLSNAIYINQAKITSAVVEMSPSKCIQLNSAIVHARDKDYSVFRGRNPHFRITNAYVTKVHDMSKYAIFAETNNYKLVLARDYNEFSSNLTGNNINNLEVILTRDVLTESFTAEGLYSHHLSGTGISEDISLFSSVGDSTSSWSEIGLVRSIEEVNSNEDNVNIELPVAVITDTDFSATLYNVEKFKSDYAYICKYLPLITNDIGDTKEIMEKFRSFNGFALNGPKLEYKAVDFSGNSFDSTDGKDETYNYVYPRETNKDNIYLNSIHAFTTINTVRTENDLEYLFNIKFGTRTSGVKCIFNYDNETKNTTASIYYVLNSIEPELDYRQIDIQERRDFVNELKTAYHLNKDILISPDNIKRVGPKPSNEICEDIQENIIGLIKVHATKDVTDEVTLVGNRYVEEHYNTLENNKTFYPIEWLAVMQKVEGVQYIEFATSDPLWKNASNYLRLSSISEILANKKYKNEREKLGYLNDYIIDNSRRSDSEFNYGFHIEIYKDDSHIEIYNEGN